MSAKPASTPTPTQTSTPANAPTPKPANQQPTKKGFGRVVTDFMLGGISGVIAKTICAPMQRIKLLLQTQHNNPKLAQRPYNGILDCFSRCVKQQGATSLWRGNMANVYRYFPTQAINFATKDALTRFFIGGLDRKQNPAKFFLGSLLAGGFAGSFSLIFVYPLDFARTRMGVDIGKSVQQRQFNGIVDCVKKIYNSDGIQGLYRGFNISVAGIFVYRAFYFGGYDAGKFFIWGDQAQQKKAGFFARFLFAQIVTSSSQTLAYPLDTVRRRLMMQSGQKTVMFTGTIDCFNKILANQGIKGFFKGNASNIWRSVGSSLVLVLYDQLQKLVDKATGV